MKMKMSKSTRSNFITYAMVIIAYVILQFMMSQGNDLQFPRRSDGTDLRIYRHGGLSEPYGGYSGGTESRTCRVYERGRLQRRRGGHQSAVGHSKRRAASDRSGDYRRCRLPLSQEY